MKIQYYAISIFFQLLFQRFATCDFKTFENSTLELLNPAYSTTINIQSSNIQAFGVWTKFIGYSQNTGEKLILNTDYDPTDYVDGQIILMIRDPKSNTILLSVYFRKFSRDSALHSVDYVYGTGLKYSDLYVSNKFYEGYWVFTYIALDPYYQYFEMLTYGGEQDERSFLTYYKKDQFSKDLTLTLGGRGKGYISNYLYNFKPFKGYISRIIYHSQLFSTQSEFKLLVNNCQIVDQCQSILTNTIIDTPLIFNGTNDHYDQIYYMGANYIVSFWLKIDYSKLIQASRMLILRMTTNKDYQDSNSFGDRVFFYRYFLSFRLNQSTIESAAYHVRYPYADKYSSVGVWKEINKLNDWSEIDLGLQSWHFVQYTQEVNADQQILDIWFPSFNKQYAVIFKIDEAFRQFGNTMMYFHVGIDKYYSSQRLQGQMAKLRFFNCVPWNYNQGLGNDCHPTCKGSCKGPTEYDCQDCYAEQNRELSLAKSRCLCILGYVESKEDHICEKFENVYTIIQQEELQIESQKYQECPTINNQGNYEEIISLTQ